MKYSKFLFLAVMIIGACSPETSVRKAPNGFEFQVVRNGEGEVGQPGLYVIMNMEYRDDQDSVWFDTKKLERPGVVMIQDTSVMKAEKGMESCFRALKKGDSVTFKVKVKSLFEDTWRAEIPPGVNPEGYMTFRIGVKDLVDREGVMKVQQEQQAKEMEKNRKLQADQIAIDVTSIESFLASKNINAEKFPEGLFMIIKNPGNGPSPTMSSIVNVTYKGTFLSDGTTFDEGTIEYPLAQLIQGWQIGFQKLKRGSKATLFVPSSLGYGPMGSPPQIPANANLIFEVELLDFK